MLVFALTDILSVPIRGCRMSVTGYWLHIYCICIVDIRETTIWLGILPLLQKKSILLSAAIVDRKFKWSSHLPYTPLFILCSLKSNNEKSRCQNDSFLALIWLWTYEWHVLFCCSCLNNIPLYIYLPLWTRKRLF